MTIYLVIPLLVIVAVLQSAVVSHLTVRGVFADLPLLIVTSWALLRGPREGVIWGFIAGVSVDLLSGAPFGAATLSLMAVGFLAGLSKGGVFHAHFLSPALVMFLATMLYSLIFLTIVWASGSLVSWLPSLVSMVLPSAPLNALLAPVVFVLVRLLQKRFSFEEMEW